tara:strand:- start:2677 stop:4722 length:2046 start_codon:yes stop_codon:yes gene_type:complete
MIEHALEYIEAGIPVFPCQPGGKSPLTSSGFHEATVDEKQIRAWWGKWPKANIGIPMGCATGLIAVDVDGADNPWPGNPELESLLNCSVTVETPSGGRHYIYSTPTGKVYRNTVSKVAPKVDTRGEGGYLIGPHSLIGEHEYKFVIGSLLEDDVTPPPPFLIKILNQYANGRLAEKKVTYSQPNLVEKGARNSTLASLGGSMRRIGMGYEEILAGLTATNDRCVPPLKPSTVKTIAKSVSRYEPDTASVEAVESVPEPDFLSLEPPPVPESLMDMPGFVNDYVDYVQKVSVYQNRPMAFAGSLAMLSYMVGRSMRGESGVCANIYLLGLAQSGDGKDMVRKVNKRLAQHADLTAGMADTLASSEGIEDALLMYPRILCQTDEVDGMLTAASKGGDSRHKRLFKFLTTVYTSTGSYIPKRIKANAESKELILNPYLSIYGTAIPKNYYEALNPEMMSDGFMARQTVIESVSRRVLNPNMDSLHDDIPQNFIDIGRYWKGLNPRSELNDVFPGYYRAGLTEDAAELDRLSGEWFDNKHWNAKKMGDSVQCSIWARAWEQERTLQLLAACSYDHENPVVTADMVESAHKLVRMNTDRMLYQSQSYQYVNQHDRNVKSVIHFLKLQPNKECSKRKLVRKFQEFSARDWDEIIGFLENSGMAVVLKDESKGKGTPGGRPKLTVSLL